MTDEQIVELYWWRNENAVSQTQQKYGALARTVSRRILTDERDSEECLSDALLRLWKAIPPERPKQLRAYLLRIVRNLALDRAQYNKAEKRASQLEMSFEELEQFLPVPDDPMQKRLDQEELRSFLHRFLSSQSAENRILFVRRYWYGESIQELSKAMHMSESKIKSSLFRTRNRLRANMTKEGIYI